jgi:hypothetical protein
VRENDRIDVGWLEAEFAKALDEQRAAADVSDIDEDIPRASDERHTAERGSPLVHADTPPLENEIDLWHGSSYSSNRVRRLYYLPTCVP